MPEELESLCRDGEMLDGLLKRFIEREEKGYRFGMTVYHLDAAKAELAKRMELVIGVVNTVAVAEAATTTGNAN